jgi:thymidylate synthase (FAD)
MMTNYCILLICLTNQMKKTRMMQVKLIDHMGNDLSPIRAAIVSNGNTDLSKYVDDDLRYTSAAVSLIKFLARGCTQGEWDKLIDEVLLEADFPSQVDSVLNHVRHMPPHWTPFGHTAITVYVKAPIFVARQLGKHQVGFVWNEISRRYVDSVPELYWPETIREKAKNKKQGSGGPHPTINHGVGTGYYQALKDTILSLLEEYENLLEDGVAPEQARMILPQSMMTEWYWTGNLYAFAKMFVARTDSHTQLETQEVAKMIGNVIQPLFPISWKALTT